MKLRVFTVILFCHFFYSLSGICFEIPPVPLGRVHDQAQMMSPEARTALENQLQEFETQTGNQLVVATFASLDGEALEDLTFRTAEIWQIGHKGSHNGAILFIFLNDRSSRFEVGYGLEDRLTDAQSKRILSQEMNPLLKEQRFDRALIVGSQAALQILVPDFKVKVLDFDSHGPGPPETAAGKKVSWNPWLTLLMALGLLALLIFIGFISSKFSKKGGGSSGASSSPSYSGSSSSSSSSSFKGGGGKFGGGGASDKW